MFEIRTYNRPLPRKKNNSVKQIVGVVNFIVENNLIACPSSKPTCVKSNHIGGRL